MDTVPVKQGKTGKKVHAATVKVVGHRVIAGRQSDVVRYDPICHVVNTHDINQRVHVFPLPTGTKITCEKCLAALA